jgi:transmembrane sensor
MTEEQYLSLCEKYLNGTCTLQEELLIKDYQEKSGMVNDEWDSKQMGDQDRIRLLLQHKLQQSMQPSQVRVVSFNRWWWYAAAAILLFITAGGYFISTVKTNQAYTAASPVKKTNTEIQPGSNKAVLTLANGKRITLDSAGNGLLSRQGGTVISKSGNGLTIKNNSKGDATLTANTLNTITIPRGGKYDITLPDGTKVWLNSSSSLIFPSAFTGSERKVTLTGEAYFEVAKNKNMPFKINVNNKQVVEVLGTHFNISAYTDERSITTTLLEGSVKVNYQNKSILIKPGQMAVNNLTTDITVEPADIDEVMAWKNGMFMFNNDNIVSIMKAISRWYDVDVAFKGNMDHINFTGNYSRGKSLSNLLKNIELMNKVHFDVEGRTATIISK